MMSQIQQKADELAKRNVFLGGPADAFDCVGRHQLITLLRHGLMPYSKVLDLGCGCLRAGYWLIHFLNPSCYFGIEPNRDMLELGMSSFIDPSTLSSKRPTFHHNDHFDCGVFGVRFDYLLARSIWSHAAPFQIEAMLDNFVRHAEDDAVFLTSYRRAKSAKKHNMDSQWVGRSHTSDRSKCVAYRFDWIQSVCSRKSLLVTELDENIRNQIWLRITKER